MKLLEIKDPYPRKMRVVLSLAKAVGTELRVPKLSQSELERAVDDAVRYIKRDDSYWRSHKPYSAQGSDKDPQRRLANRVYELIKLAMVKTSHPESDPSETFVVNLALKGLGIKRPGSSVTT